MATKVKLQLDRRSAAGKVTFTRDIVTVMTGNANFPTPEPGLPAMTTLATNLETKINARKALEIQMQELTEQINAAEALLDDGLNSLGGYVEETANKNATPENPAAAQIESAGMEVAGATGPVGPMPKVTSLSGTQGDEPGEVDLHWAPVLRGLSNYVGQTTTDPAAATGWTTLLLQKPKQSKASIGGLPSATKQWFRIAAQGSDNLGPWSDPVQVTIP